MIYLIFFLLIRFSPLFINLPQLITFIKFDNIYILKAAASYGSNASITEALC